MSITLGGIILPDLIIDNKFGRSAVRSIVEQSLGGHPIVWEDTFEGEDIILTGGNDWGWIKHNILIELQALANVPNANYILDFEGERFNVRFKNEEKPVIVAEMVIPRPNPDYDDDYNNLIIKLMEI